MKKYGKEMHGQLGGCTKIRFTPNGLKLYCNKDIDCGEYSIEEFNELTGASSGVPVDVALDVEGDYEAVCDKGIEIHYFDE